MRFAPDLGRRCFHPPAGGFVVDRAEMSTVLLQTELIDTDDHVNLGARLIKLSLSAIRLGCVVSELLLRNWYSLYHLDVCDREELWM